MIALTRSVNDVQLQQLYAAALVATSIYNYGGIGGREFKRPTELFPELFGEDSYADRYENRMKQAEEAEEEYAEQLAETARQKKLKQDAIDGLGR